MKDKKTILLFCIPLLIILGLSFFIWQKYSQYQKNTNEIASEQTKIAQLKAKDPSKNNLKKAQQKLAEYQELALQLQKKLATYTNLPKSADAPEGLSVKMLNYVNKMQQIFKEAKVTYPVNSWFGFDAYSSKLAPRKSTKVLDFQLQAFSEMFTTLIKSKPISLIDIKRQKTIEEGGNFGNKSKKKNNRKAKTPPFRSLQLVITFKSREASAMQFLNDLLNSKKFYFAVKNIKIEGSAKSPPKINQSSNYNRGDDVLSASDDTILKKMLGDETIVTQLELNIIIFTPSSQYTI